MSCLKWNCRLPGRQLEGRTPTRALTCCGCCLKHAGAPVTHGCSPAAAHRTPQTHTEQGAPQPGKQKRNFRGRQDGLCWWGTGHGFFTKPVFAISGLLKKKTNQKQKINYNASCCICRFPGTELDVVAVHGAWLHQPHSLHKKRLPAPVEGECLGFHMLCFHNQALVMLKVHASGLVVLKIVKHSV